MSKVKKSAKWSSIATAFGAIISMLQLAILAREFESSVFGQFALLNVSIEIFTALSLGGMSHYLVYKRDISQQGRNTVYFLTLAFGLVCMSLVYVLAPFIMGIVGQSVLHDELRVLSILLVISSVSSQYEALGIKNFQHPVIAKVDIFSRSAGFVTAMLTIDLQLFCLVIATITVAIFRLLIISFIFSRYSKLSLTWDSATAKDAMHFGKFNIGSTFMNVIRKQLDTLILGIILPMSELGIYHILKQLASKPGQTVQPIISKIAMPVFSEVQSDKLKLKALYLDIFLVTSLISTIIYAPIVLFSSDLTLFVFGDKYAEHHIILSILGAFWFLRIAGPTVMGALVQGTGNPKLTFNWNLLTLPVSILTITISSYFGVYWLCYSLLGLQLILLPLSNHFVVRNIIDVKALDILKLITVPLAIFSVFLVSLSLVFALPQLVVFPTFVILAAVGILELFLLFVLYKKLDYFSVPLNRLKKF